MHTRRNFLNTVFPFALEMILGQALPQISGSLTNESYRDFQTSTVPDLQKFGTSPALSEEVRRADLLLSRTPRNAGPLEIMQYLEALPDKNVDGEGYNGGWKTRWNPLIVRFFSQTKTQPAGDTTAWCAASLNWVLARSGLSGTSSASSSSFRNAPGKTNEPKLGDIVVFQSANEDEARVGHGHVALFLDARDDAIFVLGGNQKNTYGHHAVCRKWINKRGGQLVFHSYHSTHAFAI